MSACLPACLPSCLPSVRGARLAGVGGLFWSRARVEVCDVIDLGVGVGFGQLLFQLGQECLVLLVQELRLLPQPLVFFHYETVLPEQLGVEPLHDLCRSAGSESKCSIRCAIFFFLLLPKRRKMSACKRGRQSSTRNPSSQHIGN